MLILMNVVLVNATSPSKKEAKYPSLSAAFFKVRKTQANAPQGSRYPTAYPACTFMSSLTPSNAPQLKIQKLFRGLSANLAVSGKSYCHRSCK